MFAGCACSTSLHLFFALKRNCYGVAVASDFTLMAAYVGLDPFSNVGFISSKIMLLQNCLHTVQLGLDKTPEAPSIRTLSVVVSFLGLSALGWTIVGLYSSVNLRPESSENQNSENLFYVFVMAATTLIFATFSSFLYIWHITFHLRRYLKTVGQEDQANQDDENYGHPEAESELSAFGRIKKFAKNSLMNKFVKNLSGKLRRLQMSVAFISLSFLIKAVLYLFFSVKFHGSKIKKPPQVPDCSCPDSGISYYTLRLCDETVYSAELIFGRMLLGSPFLIPLITLFCDPMLIL
jgi:hypothetical protein